MQNNTIAKGGHHAAYKATLAQGVIALTAQVQLLTVANPWRSGPGVPLHVNVLQPLHATGNPYTVSDVIALAAQHGFKPKQVLGHLAWLYTWGSAASAGVGAYLAINGATYQGPAMLVHPANPATPAPATPAPTGKGKKGKGAATPTA